MIIRQDLFSENGQWIISRRNGATYLGYDLVEALLMARHLNPGEEILLDDRDFSGDIVTRHKEKNKLLGERKAVELKIVEFINEDPKKPWRPDYTTLNTDSKIKKALTK
jgi:hypothetical protein